jgi:ubiquitin-protein ligase E3 C
MITIFCDFSQFSAKKLPFFLNTNVTIHFFLNLALFLVKNADFFANFFGENISKIITSVPGIEHPIHFFPPEIVVTSDNRIEYIHLVADYKLNKQIRNQCNAFR